MKFLSLEKAERLVAITPPMRATLLEQHYRFAVEFEMARESDQSVNHPNDLYFTRTPRFYLLIIFTRKNSRKHCIQDIYIYMYMYVYMYVYVYIYIVEARAIKTPREHRFSTIFFYTASLVAVNLKWLSGTVP